MEICLACEERQRQQNNRKECFFYNTQAHKYFFDFFIATICDCKNIYIHTIKKIEREYMSNSYSAIVDNKRRRHSVQSRKKNK